MNEKKPYSPPELYRVELDQEQAILSACSLRTSSPWSGVDAIGCNRRRIRVPGPGGEFIAPCKASPDVPGDRGPRPS